MSTTAILKRRLGRVAAALDDDISDEEMDVLLAKHRHEIEALLAEAREDEKRGDEAPVEPLRDFLRRARRQLHDRAILSKRDTERVLRFLENPPKPKRALVEAALRRHRAG